MTQKLNRKKKLSMRKKDKKKNNKQIKTIFSFFLSFFLKEKTMIEVEKERRKKTNV